MRALTGLLLLALVAGTIGFVVNVPRVAGKRRRLTYFASEGLGGSPAAADPKSSGSDASSLYFGGHVEEQGTSVEEIWEFWQRRRQSMSILKNVLSDDRNANVTKEFDDFQAYTIVEKEHVKHLNELFMAAMGEASSEIMNFLWLDSAETMCAVEADEAVYSGYSNITTMWNDNFMIQKQQQVQLEMEQGKTYNLQIEQLDEPTLHFFGDTVMVQTDIRITCIVEELDALGGVQKVAMNGKGGRRGKKRKNKAGSPVQLHITNVFVRPPDSDRYFLSTHIASRESSANSAKRLSKETYLDTSSKPAARKRGGGAGVSLQQLLSGGMMGGDNKGISISSDDLDDSDDDDDEGDDDVYEDEDDYIDYDEEEGDEDDDDDSTIELSVSAADASEAQGLVNSIAEAADGKIKVIVKDEFADNFFGGDDDEDADEAEEDDEEEDEILMSGTLSADTPSLAKIFSAEIVKGAKSGDTDAGGGIGSGSSAANNVELRDAEWARQRDRQELVKELGASSPNYDIGGMDKDSSQGGNSGSNGAGVNEGVGGESGGGTIREEVSSRTLQAIRFLHASGRLSSDQKRVIVTDLLKKSVTPDLSKAEIAYSLIMEHANPEKLAWRTLGPRPDLANLSGQRSEDLMELEEMLVTIYNEWSNDDD